MPTFTITDRSRRESKTEPFLDKSISIKSHSGLHSAESSLIENLPSLKKCGTLLIAGNRTGAVAMAAAVLFPDCSITSHTCDIHHAATILRNLKGNSIIAEFSTDSYVLLNDAPDTDSENEESDTECTVDDLEPKTAAEVHDLEDAAPDGALANSSLFTVTCTSCIPENSFDNALFMITPSTTTGELVLSLLEDIHKALKMHGRCLIAYDGEPGTFTNQLKSVFSSINVLQKNRKGTTFLCPKKSELVKPRKFAAKFEASLPGTDCIELLSLPGVFSHRRPDNGGLALAEITAPLLKPGMRVMDFGCGCGIVGALLSLKEPDIHLTFIDSAIRAMDSTHQNVEALELKDTKLILSDTGIQECDFDIFAGNPPYYSDYRIAELFIDQAYKSLKPGGTALIVTKQTRNIEELVFNRFENTDVISRRGYSVVMGVKD